MALTKEDMTTTKHKSGYGLDVKKYATDSSLTVAGRVAHFLNWAADKYPKQFVQYNVLLKAIMGFSHTPRLNTQEVERLKDQMGHVAKLLYKRYGRETIAQPAVGIRASVDSADLLVNVAPRKARRLVKARDALVQTKELINLDEVPNLPEYRAYKEWLGKDVNDVLKLVNTEKFTERMLPPGSAEGSSEPK